MRIIYADNNATTAVAPEVVEAMAPFFTEDYFNPSSMYEPARRTAAAMAAGPRSSRRGTSAWPTRSRSSSPPAPRRATTRRSSARPRPTPTAATSSPRPSSTRPCWKSARTSQRNGYDVTFLGVDGDGNLDVGEFIRALRPDTLLVSIMHANNETGVIFPIEQLSRLTKETDPAIVFHTDATQSVGKLPIDLERRVPARRSAVVLRPQAARAQGRRRAVHPARHALPAAS